MPLDLEPYLVAMAESLVDADATIELTLGGLSETTRARLWRGQVLVEWEPDDEAGDCLLRPELVRRLTALGAAAEVSPTGVRLHAGPRATAKLSHRHANLGAQLGASPGLRLDLHFAGVGGAYRGGTETYVVDPGPGALLSLRVSVERRPPRGTSAQTVPGSG